MLRNVARMEFLRQNSRDEHKRSGNCSPFWGVTLRLLSATMNNFGCRNEDTFLEIFFYLIFFLFRRWLISNDISANHCLLLISHSLVQQPRLGQSPVTARLRLGHGGWSASGLISLSGNYRWQRGRLSRLLSQRSLAPALSCGN